MKKYKGLSLVLVPLILASTSAHSEKYICPPLTKEQVNTSASNEIALTGEDGETHTWNISSLREYGTVLDVGPPHSQLSDNSCGKQYCCGYAFVTAPKNRGESEVHRGAYIWAIN